VTHLLCVLRVSMTRKFQRRTALSGSIGAFSRRRQFGRHYTERSSLSAPHITIFSASGNGHWNAFASPQGARSQTSRSSSAIRFIQCRSCGPGRYGWCGTVLPWTGRNTQRGSMELTNERPIKPGRGYGMSSRGDTGRASVPMGLPLIARTMLRLIRRRRTSVTFTPSPPTKRRSSRCFGSSTATSETCRRCPASFQITLRR
jgi:hypothetical protein